MNNCINVINETQYIGDNTIVKADCFAITFKHITGSASVTINGYPMADGESLTFAQTENHIDRTQYNVVFSGLGTKSVYAFKTIPVDNYFKD